MIVVEFRHSVNFYDILGGDKQIYEEKLEDVIKVDNQPKDKKDNKKKDVKKKRKLKE